MKIILFWSNKPTESSSPTSWRGSELRFSPFHELVFKAHEKMGNEVEVWTYQKVTYWEYPSIKIKDASSMLNYEIVHKALTNGHSIAHVADAIRLKRASQVEGVVLDMDAVVLKPLPEYDSWFATMPSKKTGGFAPQWGENKPPMKVHDNSWDGKELTAFPIKVGPNTSKQVHDLAIWIMKKLETDPKASSDEWNSVLWTVKKICSTDTTAKVYQPIYFCPLPAWLGESKCYSMETPTRLDGKTELFGHTLPSIDEISDKSFIVQHFFESAWNKADSISEQKWNNLGLDSLLRKEYDYIINDIEIKTSQRPTLEKFFE